MTSTLVAGIFVAFLATTLAVAWRRAPTRMRCPGCGEPTATLQPPLWFTRMAPGFRLRWCPACSWQGVGREGPELTPGRPVSHDSGFRWGEERFPRDFGFRFAGEPDEGTQGPGAAPVEPPAHPSGFRFAQRMPLVFRWREGPGAGDFAWRTPTRRRAPRPGFRWRA